MAAAKLDAIRTTGLGRRRLGRGGRQPREIVSPPRGPHRTQELVCREGLSALAGPTPWCFGQFMGLLTRPAARGHAHRGGRQRAVLAVVCASALIVNVDNTILNVALPTPARELAATSSELQWVVDSYAMVFAGLLLVGGSLADRFWRKRFFLIGLTVFAAASVGAALSGSVDLLIGGR
jgi:hypothetical protein